MQRLKTRPAPVLPAVRSPALMPWCRASHQSPVDSCVSSDHFADLFRALTEAPNIPRAQTVVFSMEEQPTINWDISSGVLAPDALHSHLLADALDKLMDNPRIDAKKELEDIFDENGAVSAAAHPHVAHTP